MVSLAILQPDKRGFKNQIIERPTKVAKNTSKAICTTQSGSSHHFGAKHLQNPIQSSETTTMNPSALSIRTLVQYLLMFLSWGKMTWAQLDSTDVTSIGNDYETPTQSAQLDSRAARPKLAIKWCNAKAGTPNQQCKQAEIEETFCTGHDCSFVDSQQYWNSFFVINNAGYKVSLYTAEESSHCGNSNYLVADDITYGNPLSDVSVHLINTKWSVERPKYFAVMCNTTRSFFNPYY